MPRHNLFLHSALVLTRKVKPTVDAINVSTFPPFIQLWNHTYVVVSLIKSNIYDMIQNGIYFIVGVQVFPHINWNRSIYLIRHQCSCYFFDWGRLFFHNPNSGKSWVDCANLDLNKSSFLLKVSSDPYRFYLVFL